ncbi:hypothetical protein AV929_12295 [Haloarcula sp. K1]|nr:hypothetical protein AV929_12295 [Haloarcula sp. K1]
MVMISNSVLNQISMILRISLSLDFVILIFLLGEYRSMNRDSISPLRLKPLKYGILVILGSVIITVATISLRVFSDIFDFDIGVLPLLAFITQMIIITGASIWLSHIILNE